MLHPPPASNASTPLLEVVAGGLEKPKGESAVTFQRGGNCQFDWEEYMFFYCHNEIILVPTVLNQKICDH